MRPSVLRTLPKKPLCSRCLAGNSKFGADEAGRGGATFTIGVIFLVLLVFARLCLATNGLGTACLCRWRRPGGGGAVWRARQAYLDFRLHVVRVDLVTSLAGH